MKAKIYIVISWVTIISALLLVLLNLIWLLYPYNPATFRTLPHKFENNVVVGGSFLTMYIDVCKNINVSPEISRVFVGGVIYQIPTYITVDDALGCKIRKVQIYVPKGLPVGKYFVNTSYKFQVNPIRSIEMQTRSEHFEVIE